MSKWMPFFNKNEKEIQTEKIDNVPNHVAIIMDGNGRWASERGLPRIAGHKEGMEVVRRIVKEAVEQNIKVLTLYAFSTENWKRPKREIDFLMRLPIEFSNKYLREMIVKHVLIKSIGEVDSLPANTKLSISHAKEQTNHKDSLLLNFVLKYGSRDEIVRVTQQVIQDVHDGTIADSYIDEAVL